MSEHRLVLFGGQGSPSIFSPHAATNAEQDAQSVGTGNILLSRCHAAFLEETESLDAKSRHLLAIDLSLFSSPSDLLKPAVQYHTHPVLQATTIYLCQLLRYVAETLRQDGTYEHSFDTLQATAGFSSGILPATVVARSRNLDEFVASGVQGFRLAFWIACRSFFWTLKSTGDVDSDVGEHGDSEATLSLVTRGLSRAQVDQGLWHFYAQGHGSEGLPQPRQGPQRMEISAISSTGTVSISGPKADLCAFRAQLQTMPNLTTTFAYVHGWYHGGNQLESVVAQVLDDASRRVISIPPCSSPVKPIYSTLDGTLFDASKVSVDDLLAWLVRHLLVYCVNWCDTAKEIAATVGSLLEREPGATVKILSIGPSSSSLFPKFEPLDPRITLLDLSPFKAGGKSTTPSSGHERDIAIVGMSVHLPKGKDAEELWETISQGLNAVEEIPENRFKVSDFYAENPDNIKPRSMRTKYGAFLEDPFSFDNTFFMISPREAKSMDPQQRVLLHAAHEAFEDAGYVEDSSPSFQRATIGCYIGLATGDYTDNLRNDIDTFYSSGTLRAFHSGRISYFFRLSGPSIVTDTACSSSMVSIYQACRALQNGDCTAAIAGGVNVITSPDMYLGLARGHFLSRTGCCKPFDAAADGYCRAEGCALFVLKRLSDAVAEGDRIHGVIKNVAVNQSGNSSSITHPHSKTQTDLLRRLLQQADVDPGSVGVIEAHGTGTQAGDAREVETLRAVFGPHHSSTNPLMVSSIKGNIGHCEAASGAAGLAKLLLMLRERKIPIQAGLNNINPAFSDLQSSGLIIPRSTLPWSHSKRTPRRAVLNNFGAAGSNASLLLEDWVESPKGHMQRSKQDEIQGRSAYVFALSARSERALQSAVSRHIKFLGKEERQPSLLDICYTATARRHPHDHRMSLACSSVSDLLTRLQRYNNEAAASKPAQSVTATVFVFTGQGALYRGMGQELMSTCPPFRDIVLDCDRIMQGLGLACPSILNFILYDGQDGMNALTNMEQIIVSQCACVALEYALARIFMSWGIVPDYVMGHSLQGTDRYLSASLGEYAALCVSGVLTPEDTFRVVTFRAKMMSDNCPANTSGMVACNLAPGEVQEVISKNATLADLTTACLNGPADCVVGGPLAQLDTFQKDCKARKVRTRLLDVPTLSTHQPWIPSWNLYAHSGGRDYFADHARQPVRFADCLLSLQLLVGKPVLDGALFLEISPHPALLPVLRTTILSSSCTYLGTLQKGRDAWTSISETLAAISLRKIAVKWREVFAGTSARVTSLPGHLLEGSKFLIPFQEPRRILQDHSQPHMPGPDALGRVKTGYRLLPWLNAGASSSEDLVLDTDMTILGALVSGHDVGGTPICPASVFHELALEAAQTLLQLPETQVLVVSGMNFASPLVHVPSSREAAPATVCVRVTRQGSSSSGAADFRITSRNSIKGSAETLHCTGTVSVQNINVNTSHWVRDQALVGRQSQHFSGVGKEHMSTFRTKILYESIFTRVVRYSPEYQSLVYLNVAGSNLEGIGSFKMPSGPGSQTGYLVNPIFTDTLLHAAGFIANLAVGSGEIGICARVEAIEIAYHDIDYSESFTIYCSLLDIKGAILADAIALNSSGKVVAVVRGMEFKKLQLLTFRQTLSRMSSASMVESRGPEREQLPAAAPPTKLQQLQIGLDNPARRDESTRSSSTEPCSDRPFQVGISQVLKDIVVEVGGFAERDIDYTKSLGDLGIDSLMQIDIASKLAHLFPGQAGLSHHALSQCETLEAMDDMLSSVLQPSAKKQQQHRTLVDVVHEIEVTPQGSSSQSTADAASSSASSEYSSIVSDVSHDSNALPVTLHVSAGNQVPLCLFHDGSGQVGMYARLRGHDRTTFAFFDPYFGSGGGDKQHFHRSVNQMAEHYVSTILSNSKHRSSPLILGGWSFGGALAFEAAQQLTVRGLEVKGLVLIDSPSPVDHEPLPAAVIAGITTTRQPSGGGGQLTTLSDTSIALEQEFDSNASLLGAYRPESFPKATGRRLKTVMLRSQDVADTEARWGVRYDWLSRQDARAAAVLAWEELVGGRVEVLPVPGNHFEPFEKDNIGETAAQLWRACRYIEEFCEVEF
ncbi:ketoacyl-synt-domain-containing protein [Coniochaeta ligniaria NRRL 30616]|uniref:Ketoacyl-synt-domain-containing protein n=1 Tax=Coniochaeta ligniaria NRRL 30616 TaxID=1408157 RepID=A0A1J7IGR1_9PEZI|nr:ketoacyl-synt-domain-containing protein [Coniochaeta ligniaria NRRL 30616]